MQPMFLRSSSESKCSSHQAVEVLVGTYTVAQLHVTTYSPCTHFKTIIGRMTMKACAGILIAATIHFEAFDIRICHTGFKLAIVLRGLQVKAYIK